MKRIAGVVRVGRVSIPWRLKPRWPTIRRQGPSLTWSVTLLSPQMDAPQATCCSMDSKAQKSHYCRWMGYTATKKITVCLRSHPKIKVTSSMPWNPSNNPRILSKLTTCRSTTGWVTSTTSSTRVSSVAPKKLILSQKNRRLRIKRAMMQMVSLRRIRAVPDLTGTYESPFLWLFTLIFTKLLQKIN